MKRKLYAVDEIVKGLRRNCTAAGELYMVRELPLICMRAYIEVMDYRREFSRHIGHDGSLGGFVEGTARAGRNAYIDKTALVLDKGSVEDFAVMH
jgi:hypothetical protein